MTGSEAPTRDHAGMEVLTHERCLELLRSASVGRVAFVQAGTPVVLPVNYAMDGSSVLFRTAPGSKLDAAIMDRPVAFEVDHFDEADHSGWSVVLRGTATWLDDHESVTTVEVPTSWADGTERTYWVRVRPTEVTGRRIPSRGPQA